MVTELKEFRVGVYHQDCICSESTEKFDQVKMIQKSPCSVYKHKEGNMNYSLLWDIEAPNKNTLEEYLKFLKQRKDTLVLDVLQKQGASALILHRVKTPSLSYDEIMKKDFTYSEAIEVDNGFEFHTLLTKQPAKMKKILETLESIGEVKLVRVGNFREKNRLYNLTPKQINALQVAFSNGYYEWPKKARLEDLAQSYGGTRRGFQESLRKAESKIMPHMIKDILTRKNTNVN